MNTVLVGKLAKKKMNQSHGGHGFQIWLKIHLAIILGIIGGGALIFFMLIALLMLLVSTSGSDPSSDCSTGSIGTSDNVSGANGDWTHKGTKEYNATKSMFQDAEAQGMNAEHAAAMVGNGLEESGMFGVDVGQPFSITPHQTVGPGIGLYMFTKGVNVPKDMSINGQTKAILNNDLQGSKSSYIHASGSVSDLAEDFRADFEGGDKNPMRESYAEKAYQIFGNIKGGSSDDTDDTADASGSSQCGSDTDTSDIVKFAKSQLGKHPYSQPSRNSIFSEDGKSGSTADCSSFGNYIYYRTKHVHKPSGNAWTTSGGIYGLKKISANQTKPGDSVVVPTGSLAHWMILLQKWHGDNTLVIDEGGCTVRSAIKAGSPNNVNISTYGDADSDNNHVFYTPEH